MGEDHEDRSRLEQIVDISGNEKYESKREKVSKQRGVPPGKCVLCIREFFCSHIICGLNGRVKFIVVVRECFP